MGALSSWIEVRVAVPLGWHELAAEALALGPCTTVILGATSIASDPPPEGHDFVRTFFLASDDSPALRERVAKAIGGLAEATGMEELEDLSLEFLPLPAEDYATSWRKSWRPYRLRRGGRELVLLPPWDERSKAPIPADSLRLVIEPGGAFGSGRHATTRACCGVLLERIQGGERVLDAGSGSGILAVVASLAGAAECLGFDTDPAAQPAAERLALDNHATGANFRTGDLSCVDLDEAPFDVLLANIYSDVIQAQAANLAARLAPDGWFAFSGCPIYHVEPTLAAIEAAGLRVREQRLRGRWMTFVGEPARRG